MKSVLVKENGVLTWVQVERAAPRMNPPRYALPLRLRTDIRYRPNLHSDVRNVAAFDDRGNLYITRE